MESFKNIAEIVQGIATIPLGLTILTYLIVTLINNFDVTNIEVKLMRPFRKFIIPFSYFLIFSLFFTGIIILISLFEIRKVFEESIQNNITFNAFLLICGLVVFSLFIFGYLVMYISIKILSFSIGINLSYFTSENQEVIRVTAENYVVVRSQEGVEFLKDPYSHKYKSVVSSNGFKRRFYEDENSVKSVLLLTAISSFLIFGIMVTAFYKKDNIEGLFALFLLLFFIIALIVILESKLTYKRYKNNIENRSKIATLIDSTTEDATNYVKDNLERLGKIISVKHKRNIGKVGFETIIEGENKTLCIQSGFTSGGVGKGSKALAKLLVSLGFEDAEVENLVFSNNSNKFEFELKK